MKLDSCHSKKNIEDQSLLGKICFDILNANVIHKQESNKYCAIFVEGRDREINSYEDFACFKSFYTYSAYKYPIYALVKNKKNFLFDSDLINVFNIKIIEINSLNSLDKYSDFCINELYHLIPDHIGALTIQPDGFLIKFGWEQFIEQNNIDFIGAHWAHCPAVETKIDDRWINTFNSHIFGCNGGFSYRNLAKTKKISLLYRGFEHRESGTENKRPPEDLFFSYFGFLSGIFNPISLELCCKFAKDPINYNQYIDRVSFGFHSPAKNNIYCCTKHD